MELPTSNENIEFDPVESIQQWEMQLGTLNGKAIATVHCRGEILFTIEAADVREAEARVREKLRGMKGTPVLLPRPEPTQKGNAPPSGTVLAAQIQLQPRTKLLPIPMAFFIEDGEELRPRLSGNNSNDISVGFHQVDPTRRSSMTPVMPNILLARSTGNAYPSEPDDTVVSTKTYANLVSFSHRVHAELRRRETISAEDILQSYLSQAQEAFSPGDLARKIKPCILDTLRDLRLYGLATTDTKSGFTRRTHFTFVDPCSVQLVEEFNPADWVGHHDS